MIRGRIQEGYRQDGGRSETSRRKVGGISLKLAIERDVESGILECGFKKSGVQIVFK
jgi:hypothetical protein